MTEPDRLIAVTRVFDVPRDLMWKVWTDPEHIARWWGPQGFTNTIHSMDVRTGGVWRFIMHGPDGTDYDNEIVFTEIVAPERIAYHHRDPGGRPGVFHVVVDFKDLGEKTELDFRMIFESAEERERIAREHGAEEGLHGTLQCLADYLAEIAGASKGGRI